MKKLFLYLAKKLRLSTGCDAPFITIEAIERPKPKIIDTRVGRCPKWDEPVGYTGPTIYGTPHPGPADVTLASFGMPSTEMLKKTLEIFAEYNRRKQPKQKAWWEDVHTMD